MTQNFNKKVIFIGGTSRSGSTLLDQIIANDSKAMSLGEVHAIFDPIRVHHFDLIENMIKDKRWEKVIKGGKRNFYKNLFTVFPEYDYFVDSSKHVFWILYQNKIIKNIGAKVYNVLIYKKINELAKSFIKRNIKDNLAQTFLDYHTYFCSLISPFYIISYYDLVNTDESLKRLCKYLDIEYFDGKKKYWNKTQNPFFGSSTVKKQLNGYQGRKDITYDKPESEIIDKYVFELIKKFPKLKEIELLLENKKNEVNRDQLIKISGYKILIKRIKRFMKIKFKYYFPDKYVYD